MGDGGTRPISGLVVVLFVPRALRYYVISFEMNGRMDIDTVLTMHIACEGFAGSKYLIPILEVKAYVVPDGCDSITLRIKGKEVEARNEPIRTRALPASV